MFLYSLLRDGEKYLNVICFGSLPLVGDDLSVARLEGQLNGVVCIIHVIQEQGLVPYHNTHLG